MPKPIEKMDNERIMREQKQLQHERMKEERALFVKQDKIDGLRILYKNSMNTTQRNVIV